MSEYRSGIGWDIHRTGPGRALILGGVPILAEFGLVGHSDADVLSHAVTDAILGALALGDIGFHFPDTDPRWKGADSLQFLTNAVQFARERGYVVANIDATVIMERPKLRDYRPAIVAKLSEAVRAPVDAVSIKFKTSERVGPVGEGLAVEAQAVVLLRRL